MPNGASPRPGSAGPLRAAFPAVAGPGRQRRRDRRRADAAETGPDGRPAAPRAAASLPRDFGRDRSAAGLAHARRGAARAVRSAGAARRAGPPPRRRDAVHTDARARRRAEGGVCFRDPAKPLLRCESAPFCALSLGLVVLVRARWRRRRELPLPEVDDLEAAAAAGSREAAECVLRGPFHHPVRMPAGLVRARPRALHEPERGLGDQVVELDAVGSDRAGGAGDLGEVEREFGGRDHVSGIESRWPA